MMKFLSRYLAAVLVALTALSACQSPEERAACGVISRTFGRCPSNVELHFAGPSDSTDWYSLEVKNGRLSVSGSSVVALCKGFHDYIQDNGYGSVTWSGSRLALPKRIPDQELTQVVSPFKRHLFYNVCTFGYSTPYWGWKEWKKELDWLALHGFDMPLAPVGTEGILYRVYEKMGLTDAEIQAYFSGPGHFPWMRMGNMCAQDGGMSRDWHEKQIGLEHRILDRMEQLGMDPVFQGFAGFVPEAIETHFPEVNISRHDWHGLHSQLLGAKDSLFQAIGTAFIREWEDEFGKGKYYLVDSFNEMDIPFGPRGSEERYENIKAYSSATYESIRRANPNAVWVMQGWMFGRDRKLIWDPQSVKALLDGAPDDKLMIVDLAVDFNQFVWRSDKSWDFLDGFFGKEWIWSTTPNFGGRTSLKGNYDFYLNAHLDALASQNRGRLTGFGCSPEGIESNEALYEAISSAGWSGLPKDPHIFLARYFASRYGCAILDVMPFANGLLGSVYDSFTNFDNHAWASRPGIFPPNIFNINPGFFDGIKSLLALSEELGGEELYRRDAILFAAYYLFAKAEELHKDAIVAYLDGDGAKGRALADKCCEMLLGADRLLESHPTMRMQRWLDFAGQSATNREERKEFRTEAMRLVTTWDAVGIRDYASRSWSGLLRDYYEPRCRALFDALEKGGEFNNDILDNAIITRVAEDGFSPVTPYNDPLAAAIKLVSESDYRAEPDNGSVMGFWAPYAIGDDGTLSFRVNVSRSQMLNLAGFEFVCKADAPIEILGLKVGNRRVSYPDGPAKMIPAGGGFYPYSGVSEDTGLERITPFVFRMKVPKGSSGYVKIIPKS